MNSLLIYDEIGFSGTTPQDVITFLAENKGQDVTIRINSPGGSVYDGVAIYNLLKAHSGSVNVVVDSLCASIATIIALGGDNIKMNLGSTFMIHNPWTMSFGDAGELRKMADDLDKVRDQILSIYMTKFNGTKEELIAKMDAETWLSDSEALEFGFVDEVGESMRMSASLKHDVSKYFNKQKENKMAEQTVEVEAEVVAPEVENQAEEILAEVATEEVVAEVVTEEVTEEVVEISEEDRIQALVDEGIAKEMKRQSDIKDLAFEGQSELVASLISEKCSVSDASLRIITDKKAMKSAPVVKAQVEVPSEVAPVVNEAEQILASMSNGAPAPLNEGIESEGTQTLSGIRAKIEKSTDREEKRVLGMELALLKKSQS